MYRHLRPEALREGAFGITSFWGAECVALGAGSLEEAEELFRALLGHANDLGLYAEEIDPSNGEALGNFQQGFTHVGLINAALSIDRRRRGISQLPRRVEQRSPERAAISEKRL
jgi:GH15 family glucan-1,4-alpha-glucosidase